MKQLIIALFLLAVAGSAQAALEVVATTPSMGALARAIGSDQVKVKVLSPPDRDVHMLQAKPSMLRDLRRADLVVANGAELEVGWLPLALGQSANPAILPGHKGYFEAAAQVTLIDALPSADRSQGDVHPMGNPHVNMDPLRMATIGQALATRLAELDSTNAAYYRSNAERFAQQVEQRMSRWREQLDGAPGVVLFHKNAAYLLHRFNVPLLGTVEPIPGVPPGARYISGLVSDLSSKSGVIITAPYYPMQASENLADRLGWKLFIMTIEPETDASAEQYFELIDSWVDNLASAK